MQILDLQDGRRLCSARKLQPQISLRLRSVHTLGLIAPAIGLETVITYSIDLANLQSDGCMTLLSCGSMITVQGSFTSGRPPLIRLFY